MIEGKKEVTLRQKNEEVPNQHGAQRIRDYVLRETINSSNYNGICTVAEMLMEVNCPSLLSENNSVGTDNMTAIVLKFKH